MIFVASVRFWRAIHPHLPDTDGGDRLWIRLRHEPRIARKRHMSWPVELDEEEYAALRSVMDHPPTPYVAFCVEHHREDALADAARREIEGD